MRSDCRRFVAVITTVAAMALLTGACASTTKEPDWTGHKIEEVIAKFGTPSNVAPGEGGGKTYTWLIHRSVPVETQTFNAQGAPVGGTTFRDSVRTRMFVVDASGTVLTWSDSATQHSM